MARAATAPPASRRAPSSSVLRLLVAPRCSPSSITKIPADERPAQGHPHRHARRSSPPALALHLRRLRALGVALAAGARGVRRPRAAAHAAVALPRRAVRRQRPAVDDRRRRAAREPGVEDHRRRRRRVRVGGHRATQRLRRAPAAHVHRLRASSRRCSSSPHAWVALAIAGGHGRRARGDPRSSPGIPTSPAASQSHENWMRFIGAVHIGVDRIRREPRQAVGVLVAAIAYQASVRRRGLVRDPRARRLGAQRRGARLPPRGRDGAGAADLARRPRHPRGPARAAAPPARRAHREGDRRRAALVRHDAAREPARRAGVRGRAPPRRRPRRRRRRRRPATRRDAATGESTSMR